MIHRLDSVASTNTWAKEHAAGLAHGDIVITRDQTAGRGQRGNSWEAAPGMNLTFSLMLRPAHIAPRRQWAISQAVALGIAAALTDILGRTARADAPRVTVKWPNDIYAGDRKICGILIENSLDSPDHIGHSIAGIGINVNQPRFLSDAPNPVSLTQLTGIGHDLGEVLDLCVGRIMELYDRVDRPEAGSLDRLYDGMLWRRQGTHQFALPDGTRFTASIEGVDPDGRLRLTDSKGARLTFYFKEVAFIL